MLVYRLAQTLRSGNPLDLSFFLYNSVVTLLTSIQKIIISELLMSHLKLFYLSVIPQK